MKALSLHIGLNRVDPACYGGWDGRLQACENDAREMESILTRQGFQTLRLFTESATKLNVSNALLDASQRLSPDGIFVLTYSGHGTQVPDLDEGEEQDGLDEAWCLYDGLLTDDDFHLLLCNFQPGHRLVVISDCCHSGTLIHHLYPYGAPYIRASVIYLSACQDTELAFEEGLNGRLTSKLLEQLTPGFTGNYAALRNSIFFSMGQQKPCYTTVGPVNQAFEDQTPFTI